MIVRHSALLGLCRRGARTYLNPVIRTSRSHAVPALPQEGPRKGFRVLRQWVRQCFHGGATGSAVNGRSAFYNEGGASLPGANRVTGAQIVKLMVEYVWPKDNPVSGRRR